MDFKGGPTDVVRVCRVNEIVIDTTQLFIFPLRAAKDKQVRELDLPPRENIPICEGLITEETNVVEPPLLENVTPIPATGSSPGTPPIY
eukprot:15318257-Heterocapsa_arctica.AAC.1